MTTSLRTVPVAALSASAVRDLVPRLRAALDGDGPGIVPVPDVGPGSAPGATTDGPADGGPGPVPDDVALGIRTSGSTGTPRTVLLGRAALHASATATHERLGGPGRWLLSLPVTHIAGVQVLVRSVLAGTEPVVVGGPFDPAAWAAAAAETRAGAPAGTGTGGRAGGRARRARLYGSLVPTQLHRVVAAARQDPAVRRDLDRGRPDAILLGGAAAPAGLLDDATALGLHVVRTFGMSETAGGCVYDGVPLDGVRVRLVDDVVEIAGPVLAHGYLGRPDLDAAAFRDEDGVRWFVTQDLGSHDGERLSVLGRRDDVIVSGGVNVAPAAVESVLSTVVPGDVCVVGVPDEEWGHAVVAVVTRPAELATLRDHVRRSLGAAAAPRHVVVVDRLPQTGPGKVDRAAVARHATAALAP